MKTNDEKPLKNREVCLMLHVTDYKRRQLITCGILDPPIDTGGAFPEHTLSQIHRARERMNKEAAPKSRPPTSGARTKPISKSLLAQIRGSRFTK